VLANIKGAKPRRVRHHRKTPFLAQLPRQRRDPRAAKPLARSGGQGRAGGVAQASARLSGSTRVGCPNRPAAATETNRCANRPGINNLGLVEPCANPTAISAGQVRQPTQPVGVGRFLGITPGIQRHHREQKSATFSSKRTTGGKRLVVPAPSFAVRARCAARRSRFRGDFVGRGSGSGPSGVRPIAALGAPRGPPPTVGVRRRLM